MARCRAILDDKILSDPDIEQCPKEAKYLIKIECPKGHTRYPEVIACEEHTAMTRLGKMSGCAHCYGLTEVIRVTDL